jgi:hypothetical protein
VDAKTRQFLASELIVVGGGDRHEQKLLVGKHYKDNKLSFNQQLEQY